MPQIGKVLHEVEAEVDWAREMGPLNPYDLRRPYDLPRLRRVLRARIDLPREHTMIGKMLLYRLGNTMIGKMLLYRLPNTMPPTISSAASSKTPRTRSSRNVPTRRAACRWSRTQRTCKCAAQQPATGRCGHMSRYRSVHFTSLHFESPNSSPGYRAVVTLPPSSSSHAIASSIVVSSSITSRKMSPFELGEQ